MNHNVIKKALQWRYACKKFDSGKKIPDQDWELLLTSLRDAPTSYGLQPFRFILVENAALREKLRAVSWNQAQVTDASHFLVVISKAKVTNEDVDHFMALNSRIRNVSLDSLKGYRDMIVKNVVDAMTVGQCLEWTRRQAYIALGFLLETAALLGIDTTPMEGLDPETYDSILGLGPTGYKTVAAVALGYRHVEDRNQSLAKVRYPIPELIEVRK
jgi:nitroreductase